MNTILSFSNDLTFLFFAPTTTDAPAVVGGPHEFEPSVDWSRCRNFEIADFGRTDNPGEPQKLDRDLTIQKIEDYLETPTVKVFAEVSYKHLATMMRAANAAGLRSLEDL